MMQTNLAALEMSDLPDVEEVRKDVEVATPRTRHTTAHSTSMTSAADPHFDFHQEALPCQSFRDLLLAICGEEQEVLVTRLIARIKLAGLRPFKDLRLRPLIDRILIRKIGSGEEIYTEFNIEKRFDIDALLADLPETCLTLMKKALIGRCIIPEFARLTTDLIKMFDSVRRDVPDPDGRGWGVALCTVDGQQWAHGDYKKLVTLQSCSAALNYAMAVTKLGNEFVHQYVGKESTNSGQTDAIHLDKNGLPHNALIQAGAISITSLLLNIEPHIPSCFEDSIKMYNKMAGGNFLKINNTVYLAEKSCSDRKFSISYFLKEHQVFPKGSNLKNIIDLYFQLNSVEVTCESGAMIAASLANGGTCPTTGEKVLTETAVQNTLSIMQLNGMYGYSGEWMFEMGIPAKSCKSGTILVVVPGVMGMCLYSPHLDEHGNSARGVEFVKRMTRRYALHFLDNHISAPQSKENLAQRHEGRETQDQVIMNVMFAAVHGDMNLLNRYSETGVDLNISDYDGRTALHLACCNDNIRIAKYLIEHSVDIHALDRWNRTPLDDALKYGSVEMIDLLKKHGGHEGPGTIEVECDL